MVKSDLLWKSVVSLHIEKNSLSIQAEFEKSGLFYCTSARFLLRDNWPPSQYLATIAVGSHYAIAVIDIAWHQFNRLGDSFYLAQWDPGLRKTHSVFTANDSWLRRNRSGNSKLIGYRNNIYIFFFLQTITAKWTAVLLQQVMGHTIF